MDVKPGYQTTEFWLTVIAQGVLLGRLFGFIDDDEAQHIEGIKDQLVELALLVMPVIVYTVSRAWVKVRLG